MAAPGADSAAAGKSLQVAVIGGGAAGVVACRFLRDAGHHPRVFEAGGDSGGIWALEPTNQVVYKNLVTNLPHKVMQSFDLDFKPGLRSYIEGHDLGEYIVQYSHHFGLRPLMEFGAQVTRVRPLRSEAQEEREGGSWEVCWSGREGERSAEFDAVVVGTGHYSDPYVPEIPGQKAWLAAAAPGARTVSHAREYDVPSILSGRVVLVVGGRSSAVDIAREMRGSARWVYVLEKGCRSVQTVGTCTHLPLGAELGEDGQMHVKGAVAPGLPVDNVVLATGYTYNFPFLDTEEVGLDFGPVARYVAPLYQHVVHARRPSLCFMGMPLAIPCPIPLFEAQARFAAAHLRGGSADATAVTTRDVREGWAAERRSHVGERQQDMHVLGDQSWDYMRGLMRLAGMSDAEYEAYDRRLTLVTQIYNDRCLRRPQLPWDDDQYRRCEYAVDWEAGTWAVTPPPADGEPEKCAKT